MYKELIIVIIIIVLVIIGNIVTQKNTNNTVEIMRQQLTIFKNEITAENINKKNIQENINKINDLWEEKFDKMAYYIEHDELEKVTTELTKLKADVEIGNYDFAIENLDSCIFIIEHIKDKSALKVVNIF